MQSSQANLDTYCEEVTTKSPNLLVAWWIMAAWAYEKSSPIISDAQFDKVAQKLEKNWKKIEHRHKVHLDKSLLKSSLAIGNRWPTIAVSAAECLMRVVESKQKATNNATQLGPDNSEDTVSSPVRSSATLRKPQAEAKGKALTGNRASKAVERVSSIRPTAEPRARGLGGNRAKGAKGKKGQERPGRKGSRKAKRS